MTMASTSTPPLPTYYLSHGGGPWPWMPQMHDAMQALERSLRDIPGQLGTRPAAIVIVSGHWEDPAFAVMSNAYPPMLYDYHGFPRHTYEVRYTAPGAPGLAARVAGLIEAAGLPSRLEPQRGFDHGTFVPLHVMFPAADVPVVQVALQHTLDPARHLALGRALAPLRHEGVLIVGSGQSYHNLQRFGAPGRAASVAFDQWLQETLVDADPAERERRLVDWQHAPAARLAHPREEHLIPLMMAVGAAATEPAQCVYHEEGIFGGVTASSFRFG